jgi:hypothetical protein
MNISPDLSNQIMDLQFSKNDSESSPIDDTTEIIMDSNKTNILSDTNTPELLLNDSTRFSDNDDEPDGVPLYPSKVKLLSRMALNTDKAGMDKCDRERIDRAIYEASKVSVENLSSSS